MGFFYFMRIRSRFSRKKLVNITFHYKSLKERTSSEKKGNDGFSPIYANQVEIFPKRTRKSNFSLEIPQIGN